MIEIIKLSKPLDTGEKVYTELEIDSEKITMDHIKHITLREFDNPTMESLLNVASNYLLIPTAYLKKLSVKDGMRINMVIINFLASGLETQTN